MCDRAKKIAKAMQKNVQIYLALTFERGRCLPESNQQQVVFLPVGKI